MDGDESVHLVEEELQFREFSVEEFSHAMSLNHFLESFESDGFVSEGEEEEAGNEIHTLTVFNFWVEESIAFKDICEDLRWESFHFSE